MQPHIPPTGTEPMYNGGDNVGYLKQGDLFLNVIQTYIIYRDDKMKFDNSDANYLQGLFLRNGVS